MIKLSFTFIILLLCQLSFIRARICSSNVDCPISTECEDGKCTNAFEMGCLQAMAKRHNDTTRTVKARVCNSDDIKLGEKAKCTKPDFNYTEVRISLQNWDEVIGVPVTVETGDRKKNANYSFYGRDFQYGYPEREYPMIDLDVAHAIGGDCRLTTEPCAHVMPYLWTELLIEAKPFQENGSILPEEIIGISGGFGIYIPLYTAKRDITLLDYQGMQGEKNRKKIAERFLSPTTFSDYCMIYTANNCTVFDATATRAPNNKTEGEKFFIEGIYNGYFRKADSNDCDKNPKTCTGHIIIPPCNSSTFTESQFFWNDIALSGSGSDVNKGYSTNDMTDILKAGIKTESDVIIWWYEPDVMPFQYEGTRSALQRVSLPRPTQECLEYRKSFDTCSEMPEMRLGNQPIGSCDYKNERPHRLFSKSLETLKDTSDLLKRSPAIDYLKQVVIPQYGLHELLSVWSQLQRNNTMNFQREAVCQYVYDNLEVLDLGYPQGYPTNVVYLQNQTLSNIGVIFGIIGLFVSLLTFALLNKWKHKKNLRQAHPNLLCFIVAGFAMISVAAIFGSMEPSNWSCAITQWFQSIGYTVEVSTTCILFSTVGVKTNHFAYKIPLQAIMIFFHSALFLIILYLTIWTAIDLPSSKISHKLDPQQSTNLISLTSCVCDSNIWEIALLVWEALLFLFAFFSTSMSKSAFDKWNQGNNLMKMLRGQFFFLFLRILCFALHVTVQIRSFTAFKWISILLGLDTIVSMMLYFLPLLFFLYEYQDPIEEEVVDGEKD